MTGTSTDGVDFRTGGVAILGVEDDRFAWHAFTSIRSTTNQPTGLFGHRERGCGSRNTRAQLGASPGDQKRLTTVAKNSVGRWQIAKRAFSGRQPKRLTARGARFPPRQGGSCAPKGSIEYSSVEILAVETPGRCSSPASPPWVRSRRRLRSQMRGHWRSAIVAVVAVCAVGLPCSPADKSSALTFLRGHKSGRQPIRHRRR